MLKTFRTISILEGLSYLVILSVTLGVIGREWVFPLGITHGMLFILYLVVSLIVSGKKGWPVWGWLILFLASLVPFAFIPVETYFRKMDQDNSRELEAIA
jgi:integral membrane protein